MAGASRASVDAAAARRLASGHVAERTLLALTRNVASSSSPQKDTTSFSLVLLRVRVLPSADLLGPLSGTKGMSPTINIGAGSTDPVPVAAEAEFLPMDDYNKKLVENGFPPDYENPQPLDKYDLVSTALSATA